MAIRFVTYNIQYGIGMDGRFDLARIVEAVSGADIVAFQEIASGMPPHVERDLEAALLERLPEMFSCFHFPVDVALDSRVEQGRAVSRRFRFGNAIFSRFPILAARGHLLPRRSRAARLNLQRGALEALIATPSGNLRCYCVHLDHVDPEERLMQVEALRELVHSYPSTGASVTGLAEMGFPELPEAPEFLVTGDFNFEPGSREYEAMEEAGMRDVTSGDPAPSCFHPAGLDRAKRLDHAFLSPGLASRAHSARVDGDAMGSDHRPVWFTLD